MKYKYLIFMIIVCFSFIKCVDVLDKKDLSAIDGTDVWNDEKLATAYVNDLTQQNLPGWDAFASGRSDESDGNNGTIYGQLTINSIDVWPYANIRKINILLADIDKGSLDLSTKNKLKGQAYFLRAWRYFEMVRLYGGVPLVLEPQERTDGTALNVSRNKTSECIAQIVSDLNAAITMLPRKWTGIDYGRVNRAAALALKGRVLLYYASPQFTPTGTQQKWQAAYEANKAAKDSLIKYGFGLHDSYANLWFDEGEGNKEVIFGHRYNDPGATHGRDACVRPLDESANCAGGSNPSLEIVESFPMKNGLPISDSASGYNPASFWSNRDPRFDATIVYNGALYELSAKSGRRQWTYNGGELNSPTKTGFYCRKAINTKLSPAEGQRSGTDWIEIRFAEVLLNLAECANELNKIPEAYDELKAIRKRAGIDAGASSLYGLKSGMTQAEMLSAIMLERKIEFAFEDKRYWDLRRRRMFETELNGKSRTRATYALKGISQDDFKKIRDAVNLNDGKFTDYFTITREQLDPTIKINFRPEYYFYGIPQTHLQLNANLKQTNGWPDGSFNPLD